MIPTVRADRLKSLADWHETKAFKRRHHGVSPEIDEQVARTHEEAARRLRRLLEPDEH